MKKKNNSHSMNFEIDSDDKDFKIKKSKIKSSSIDSWVYAQYQEKYKELIEKEDFQGCLDLYNSGELKQKPRTIGCEIDENKSKGINKAKYNGPFDWISIDDGTYNSIQETLVRIPVPKAPVERAVISKNETLGHNDYWYWIEDEEPSKNTFEFVQSIRKYQEKALIFLEEVNDSKYQFAGYGKFDFKQSVCQGRLVFRRF